MFIISERTTSIDGLITYPLLHVRHFPVSDFVDFRIEWLCPPFPVVLSFALGCNEDQFQMELEQQLRNNLIDPREEEQKRLLITRHIR